MARQSHLLLTAVEVVGIILSLVLFLTIILPAITILFIPLYIWRVLLIVITKVFRKNVWKILGGRNPMLARDDLHGRPLSTIIGMGLFDEGLSTKEASDYVANVVNATDPKTGLLLYPTLRHHYVEWLGFFWWKPEKNFNLEEHIFVWNGGDNSEPITEDGFIQIVSDLERRPFPERKSPWEVLLIPNCLFHSVKNPHTRKFALVFRFHHGFADGVSVTRVFMKYVFEMQKTDGSVQVERDQYYRAVHRAVAALKLPYEFLKQGISATDLNPWHLPAHKLSRNIFKAWTPRIPLEDIKRVKLSYGVGFTAVIVAVIAGAIRKMMLMHKIQVPKKMHAIVPLPWPNHPNKFCNHWSYGFIGLPVGTADGRERLRKSQKYIEALKRSPSPYVNFAILNFFNLLPTWVMKRTMLTTQFPTLVLSTFPGPPSGTEGIGGYPVVDAMFTGGPLPGNIGISITILSCNGALRIVAGVDSAIFPTQDMTNRLIESISDELRELQAQEMA